MQSTSYHFFEDRNDSQDGLNKSSRRSDERPLLVNCAGRFVTDALFTTHNVSGRDDYYFLYVCEGNLDVYTLNGSKKSLSAGGFVIFPPNLEYKYSHSENRRLHYVWIHFTGRDVTDILEEFKIQLSPELNTISAIAEMSGRFQSFFDSCARQTVFRDSELAISFNSILLTIAKNTSESDCRSTLKKSISHIHSGYGGDITVPTLAKLENLSVSRYNTVFKELTGITPMQYVMKIRINAAKELLVGTDLPIKDVGLHVGYADSHFFSRIFRQNTGMTPGEYRNKK